jgi:hypothetical protein
MSTRNVSSGADVVIFGKAAQRFVHGPLIQSGAAADAAHTWPADPVVIGLICQGHHQAGFGRVRHGGAE